MKAQDLRIGNWVYSPRLNEEYAFSSFFHLHYFSSECEPIPLTEEWLLKFGFRLINNPNKHYAILNPKGFKDSYLIHLFPTINDQWHLALSDNLTGKDRDYIPATHIKYVHQAQNLFHALTGEELTIK